MKLFRYFFLLLAFMVSGLVNANQSDFENTVKFLFGDDWSVINYKECSIQNKDGASQIFLNSIDISKASINSETSYLANQLLNMPVYVYTVRAPVSGLAQVSKGESQKDFFAVVGAPLSQHSYGVAFVCGFMGRGTCGDSSDQTRIRNAFKHLYSKHCKSAKVAY